MTAACKCRWCQHWHYAGDEVLLNPELCIECYEVGVAHADPELRATEEIGQGNRVTGLNG